MSSEGSEVIKETLRLQEPTRVVAFVRKASLFWQSACTSSSAIVAETLSILDVQPSQSQEKFLVNEKWPFLNLFVFDLYHDAYRLTSAHLPCQLPVVIVDFARAQNKVSFAPSFRRDEVNAGVAMHHNLNGWTKAPPFVVDYTSSTPSYPNPRDPSRLISSRPPAY
ncbi:MAG: hypothetical protein M1817_001379 [Caeruleum heppii]|nr:MAG: hypothetical protein M1817_001379 [Caeruleum heppii]